MEASQPQPGFVTWPNLLSAFRLAIIPVQMGLAWSGQAGIFSAIFLGQILSDFLDGFLARRLRQVSELGAKLDSWADLATYMSVPLCAWWLWPELVRRESSFLLAGVAGYLIPVAVGFCKYRRLTSYHTWISKASAVLMPAGLLILFAQGPVWPFHLATVLFVISGVEEILITLVLPGYRSNVATLWHALQ